ncbi:prepilin peptidase [Salmonella enterica]|nr:prepilin peptidase [Salmonella enterica]
MSLRYPLVELLVILLSVVGWLRFNTDYYLFIGFSVILVFSVAAAFIDVDTRKIPDALTRTLLIIGLLFNVGGGFASLEESVCGAIFVFIAFHLFSDAMEWTCKKPAIGGGDIKFFTAITAWFGIGCMPFIIFAASLITLTIVVITRIFCGINVTDKKIPFAPGISVSVLLYSLIVYSDPFNIATYPFLFNLR